MRLAAEGGMRNPLPPGGPWSPVERTRVVIFAVVTAFLVATASLLAWRFSQPAGPPARGTAPVGLAFDVTHIGGSPSMNTSDFWVARITRVSGNETLSSYKASLLRNGSVLVEPVTVAPGRLGKSTHPVFEFFDWGNSCSPTPCPPPQGPAGILSVNDYFRISYPDPGTAYTVRVIWGETGEVAGEIVINT